MLSVLLEKVIKLMMADKDLFLEFNEKPADDEDFDEFFK